MPHKVIWTESAAEDLDALFDYLTENASTLTASSLCEKLILTTEKLERFPRLYEAAPEYGQGVRRISQQGQNVLYEIDDVSQIVRVLAVVGSRQDAQKIREQQGFKA